MQENKSFEASLAELEAVIKKMESENVTLDESIALFEQGMRLSRDCSEKLENAKQKIITLTEAEERESEEQYGN